MTGPDLAPDAPRTQRCVAAVLRIIAVGDNVIAGAGFLPDHVVVLASLMQPMKAATI